VAITQGIITMGCCIAAQKLSGGHFNWAVTIALAGLKRMPVGAAFYYILAQTLGSFVAAFLIDTLSPEEYQKAT
jgi:glycerol uptake facilitator-like aquaporin